MKFHSSNGYLEGSETHDTEVKNLKEAKGLCDKLNHKYFFISQEYKTRRFGRTVYIFVWRRYDRKNGIYTKTNSGRSQRSI